MMGTSLTKKGALFFSATLLSTPLVVQGARAAASERVSAPTAVEAVVVTARKRDETLLNAPITVEALTKSQLARNPSTDIQQLTDMLANVTAAKGGSGTLGSFNIRGIGTNGGDSGTDQAVTVVVDDVPIARGTAAAANYFDLANIQVLPGPQALYFGKDASGGVIALQTAGPTRYFEAYVKAGYEFNAAERYVDAAISGPLTDALSARLAVHASQQDGWMRNDSGPQINPIEGTPAFQLQPGASHSTIGADNSVAARVSLHYKPDERFTADFKFLVSRYHSDEISGTTEVVYCSPGQTHPEQFGIPDPYGDCTANGHTSIGNMNSAVAQNYPQAGNGQGYLSANSVQSSLKLNYEFDAFRLTSVTGYYGMNDHGLGNFSYTTFDYFPGVNTDNERVFTEELRAGTKFNGPLNFIAGFYFDRGSRVSSTIGRGLIFGYLPGVNTSIPVAGSDIPLPTDIGYYPEDHAVTHTYSGFIEGNFKILKNLELDGGVRYSKVTETSLSRNRYIDPFYLSLFAGLPTGMPCNAVGLPASVACLFVPPSDSVLIQHDETNVSPEATLTWHPMPDTTLYASYKTGYKAGAVSNPSVLLESNLGSDPTRSLNFGPEKSKGFEIGGKASLLDHRLSLAATFYDYEFDGLQLSIFDSTTTSFLIRNAGSAVTRGAEVQAAFAVTPDFTLSTTVDYNDGYFSKYVNAACYIAQTAAQGCNVPAVDSNGNVIPGSFVQDLSGTPLADAPKWVILGGFNWTTAMPTAAGLRLGFEGDFKYSDSYRTSISGEPFANQAAFVKFNAQLKLSDKDDRWELALIGRNLTNRYTVVGAVNQPGTGNPQDHFTQELVGQVERGREVVLQLTFHTR